MKFVSEYGIVPRLRIEEGWNSGPPAPMLVSLFSIVNPRSIGRRTGLDDYLPDPWEMRDA